jgi:signal transduction histidine kinase/HAMP domain-containing protein
VWRSIGIQTKILIPVFVLMTLSVFGATIGFLVSTNTTRNNIVERQLDTVATRIQDGYKQEQLHVFNAATSLARDSQMLEALLSKPITPQHIDQIHNRATIIYSRYTLDELIIQEPTGNLLVNKNNYTDLSRTKVYEFPELTPCTVQSSMTLLETSAGKMLVGCAPIWGTFEQATTPKRVAIATVYTVIEIPSMIRRFHQQLGLDGKIHLVTGSDEPTQDVRGSFGRSYKRYVAETVEGYQTRLINLNPDSKASPDLELIIQISTQEIQQTVLSGFWVMLISSGLTLVLMLALGIWLARGITRPILKLARVARAVAAGDFSMRSNLTHNDEIGQLGQALDQATITITDLLAQRDHKTGEMQAILQSMADGVLAIDTQEQIVVVNRMAATLLGYEREAIIDQPLGRLSQKDPILATGLQHIVDQLRSELGNTSSLYHHHLHQECLSFGNRILRLQSAPTLGSGDVITGAVVVLQDQTKEAESDRAKNAFIATASHELRTPLAGLKGFVDLFRLSGVENLTENQRFFLESIKRQTNNLVLLVNDLLEVARLEQGTTQVERRWVALESMVEEVVTMLKPQIEERHITLKVELEPTLPQVWIDSLHLRRILLNLVSNAVKYVHQGGEVRIWGYELHNPTHLPSTPINQDWQAKEKRSVVVEIEDNGVGISAADQQHLFQRFFRSDNPLSVEAGGTGLGLAITHSLVQLHKGQIGFWSVEGEGSCFWVRLPAPTTELLPEAYGEEQQVQQV